MVVFYMTLYWSCDFVEKLTLLQELRRSCIYGRIIDDTLLVL